MKMGVFLDVSLRSLKYIKRRFRGVYSIANPGLEVRSYGNTILLNSSTNSTIILRYFNTTTTTTTNNNNNNMPLLCL
jgi:hypothetical protein